MGIDEVEAIRRFGEEDADGKKPTLATIMARAEREKAMDEKQRGIAMSTTQESDR